jgi:hypothetical protein
MGLVVHQEVCRNTRWGAGGLGENFLEATQEVAAACLRRLHDQACQDRMVAGPEYRIVAGIVVGQRNAAAAVNLTLAFGYVAADSPERLRGGQDEHHS